MSYIRSGWDYKYVEGESTDYVFLCGDGKGNDFVEDYGKISDKGFVDLLFRHWKTEDIAFKNHLLRRLANRLNVKIRKKPLTWEKQFDMMQRKIQKRRMNEIKGMNGGR
jgi:hypothetical protein